MSSVEDRMHAAMSAAADLAAREIPAAPPLRLPPETARGARRARPPRRWIRWTVPLAAAAAVVVLAGSLALIKDIQNGSMVPPNPATTTGPGGIPRYYVALKQLATYTDVVVPPAGIVVGDSLTGGTLATFAPPARTTFASVTAAADDRTFVVFAVTSSTGSFAAKARTTLTGRWYQVRLAPGAARPARLTRLPVKPVILTHDIPADAAQAALTGPFATALSGSGRELAVPEWVAPHGLAVKVFSVATGRLLHEWTVSDPSLTPAQPYLTWIDGDKSLAIGSFFSSNPAASDFTVREWPVAGSASGDLAAVSKIVWSLRFTTNPSTTLQDCVGRGAFTSVPTARPSAARPLPRCRTAPYSGSTHTRSRRAPRQRRRAGSTRRCGSAIARAAPSSCLRCCGPAHRAARSSARGSRRC